MTASDDHRDGDANAVTPQEAADERGPSVSSRSSSSLGSHSSSRTESSRSGSGSRSGSSSGVRSRSRSSSRSRSARRKRRNRRIVWWTVGTLAVVVLLSLGWVGVRAFLAKNELEAAVPLASQAQAQVVAHEVEAAVATSETLADHASRAAALTSDPVWRGMEIIPWAGDNLRGMRVLAAATDRVATGAVLPLAKASATLDLGAFAPVDGRIDLQPIIDLQEPVRAASAAFQQADQMIATEHLDSADLIGPLADARDKFTGLLDEAAPLVTAVDKASQLVPAMLGVDGPREILLLFQNNAELRSTGGIPGALALLRTEGGAFRSSFRKR